MASNPQTERKDRRGAPKGKWGQPPHEPTDETRVIVKTMIACGASHELIAHRLGFSADTLVRHYQEEIEYGLQDANVIIAGRLFQLANGTLHRTNQAGQVTQENVDHNVMQRSIQLWLDRRGGPEWRQRQRLSYANEFGTAEDEIENRPDEAEVENLKVEITFVGPKALPGPDDEK